MLHYLRIAVTALSLTACVLLVVLWARSLWKGTDYKQFATRNYRYEISSEAGKRVMVKRRRIFISTEITLAHPKEMISDLIEHTKFGFGRYSSDKFCGVSIAYWLLIPVVMTVAGVPWIRWSFSLHTLLIATTLVAVVLGIITGTS